MTTATAIRRSTDAPHTDALRPEELRGRATGVVVGAVMGLTWAVSAIAALSPVVALPLLVVGVAVFALLMIGAHRSGRAATALAAPASPGPDLSQVRHRFSLVVAGEAAVILVAVNILLRSDHSEWIPATVCAVVGLHFVPLARLFRLRLYDASAAGLCLVAATTMVLGTAGAPSAVWQLLPGFGAALALWATAGAVLVTSSR